MPGGVYSRRSRPLGRAVGQSLLAIQTDQPPNAQSVAPPSHFQSSSTHRQVRSDSRYRLQSPECLWIVDLRVLSQLQLDHPKLLGERQVGSHRALHAPVGEADAIGVIRNFFSRAATLYCVRVLVTCVVACPRRRPSMHGWENGAALRPAVH